jgi:uncharacterized protein YcfJ
MAFRHFFAAGEFLHMKAYRALGAVLAIASLSACSSRPRQFAPTLAAAPADQTQFATDYENCRVLVANGQRSGFGSTMASAGVGTAAGVGVGVAMAGGTYSTVAAATAAAATTVILMPIAGVIGAWGMAKRSKLKKEKEVKAATQLCLTENGYTVAAWKHDKKQKRIKRIKAPAAAAKA